MGCIKRGRLALQTRDFEILTCLFECRVMTLLHVTNLFFAGRREAAKKRIQKLKASGHLLERPREPGDPSILYLSGKGFSALREAGRLAGFPEISRITFRKRALVSALTLQHELEVMDIRAAFFRMVCEHPHLTIEEFRTWPAPEFTATCNSRQGRKETLVRPDGFIRVRERTPIGPMDHRFFLEVDRSTESLEVLAQKAACYLDYYQSGGMALRCGAQRGEYKAYPFRVLMVLKTDARRKNVAERLLRNDPPTLTQVWLTTSDKCLVSPFDEIWHCPKDLLGRGTKSSVDADSAKNSGLSLFKSRDPS